MLSGFWKKLKKPFTILAPMAEVTDVPFRAIVRELGRFTRTGSFGGRGGPDVFYTEFVSADGLASKGREKLIKNLAFRKVEKPIVAQFFGANPTHIREAAALARELGFDGVDINMGCPDRKVVKQGAGIALCKNPALAREIIAAAKEGAKNIPVSIKTRLGYGTVSLQWIEALLETEISALIVHLRTMKEMSKVPAHWELMEEISAMAHAKGTLAVGNGDVRDMNEVREKCVSYGADGVMIGRGVFANPMVFSGRDFSVLPPKERIAILLQHVRLFDEFWGTGKNFDVMKRFFKIYVSDWEGAKDLRIKLMEAKSAVEAERIISETPDTLLAPRQSSAGS